MAQQPVQSVDRALQLLLAFDGAGQELRLGELARRLDVHKSTASRLAATLEARGFLWRDGDVFRLGPQLMRLGLLAGPVGALTDVARGPMRALGSRTRECVTLTVPGSGVAVNVAEVNAPHVVGVSTWIGYRTPLHATSDGKVLLAFGAGSLGAHDDLEPLTAQTLTARDALEQALRRIREQGFATAVGEFEDSLNGAAAPVWDASGRCVAALSVSGPAYRVTPDRLPELAEACVRTAAEIGALVGLVPAWSAA